MGFWKGLNLMTKERTQEIEFIRSEIVGPARPLLDLGSKDLVAPDSQSRFIYPTSLPGSGLPLFWRHSDDMPLQEIIHFRNETPLNRYGTGMLFPVGMLAQEPHKIDEEITSGSTEVEENLSEGILAITTDDEQNIEPSRYNSEPTEVNNDFDDDFDVTSPDMYHPSTLAISFCLNDCGGELVISLPVSKQFFWQSQFDEPIQLNGIYKKGEKTVIADGKSNSFPAWLRSPATTQNSSVRFSINKFKPGQKFEEYLPLPESSPLKLKIEVFPRKFSDKWIVTVVLRNVANVLEQTTKEMKITNTLFQSFFEVRTENTSFSRYPEGVRPFEDLDNDEQTLALLYQDSATWAIGHGCSAGWDAALGEMPDCIYADVMPAVELPSMTPDIKDFDGNSVKLSMLELAELPEYDPSESAWKALDNLAELYDNWINLQRNKIKDLDEHLQGVSNRHIDSCQQSYERIIKGLDLLRNDQLARQAFKLANRSMLLQQIATKQLKKRDLIWNGQWVEPEEPIDQDARSPADTYPSKIKNNLGYWRAFQVAFLLMSIDGLVNEVTSLDRDVVDLIWFPTGGGKTEAYLGVAAFHLFYQRLLMKPEDILARDGTGVFMRYTLRMLTTQQFQRAASLICSMEYIRQIENNGNKLRLGETSFSLGLWVGGEGSPNKCDEAKTRINEFKRGKVAGNPLVLTECPWCRSEIGKIADDPRAKNKLKGLPRWADICLAGFTEIKGQPVLKCSDDKCLFGGEYGSLPIEVIDERIYAQPPSLFIGTADKFAMMSYKPEAGSLFGRRHSSNGAVKQVKRPPGLIIQDEFHLISGPLGTMYGIYESIIEKLCSFESNTGNVIKPKIVASTATIRGASEQVKSVYARDKLQLFPSPGLLMKDSFFGRYEMNEDGKTLASGRLYLGIHAESYGSFLTTQVRVFTASLFRAGVLEDSKKDAWWTLLTFYNSLRELGGARTLFDSDIASRLKNYFFRYGYDKDSSRYLNQVVELTSRRSQAELVELMDRLSMNWQPKNRKIIDACLASNIIEVGVDIDRLSLMAVVGQPKSTAQYIQVTGRVGRQWWERPGLILSMYNPSKSRDRSHFEQFHTYHRRLYERVEPTSATPFSVEAIKRALPGVLILWARQFHDSTTPSGRIGDFENYLKVARDIIIERCKVIVADKLEQDRVICAIEDSYQNLINKWHKNPQKWQEYPQKNDGEYLMLWPGQYATDTQKQKGVTIPSSMRNVDASAFMNITDLYIEDGSF